MDGSQSRHLYVSKKLSNYLAKYFIFAFYFDRIIAKGAGGGRGSDGFGSSRGASARIVLELFKGEKIYTLVGQEGASACYKVAIILIFFILVMSFSK